MKEIIDQVNRHLKVEIVAILKNGEAEDLALGVAHYINQELAKHEILWPDLKLKDLRVEDAVAEDLAKIEKIEALFTRDELLPPR